MIILQPRDLFCAVCSALVTHYQWRDEWVPVPHDAPCWRQCAAIVSYDAWMLSSAVHRPGCEACED